MVTRTIGGITVPLDNRYCWPERRNHLADPLSTTANIQKIMMEAMLAIGIQIALQSTGMADADGLPGTEMYHEWCTTAFALGDLPTVTTEA